MEKDKTKTTNEAWRELFDKYNITSEVQNNKLFYISAAQIKKYKEPRLMAKWDSTEQLPEVLRNSKINILPDSRGTYVMGQFELYESIPFTNEKVVDMRHVELPEFESIDVNSISSEADAIVALTVSGILEDFLNVKNNVPTFNGRKGTGDFDFIINTVNGDRVNIEVKKAQCEIDAGFENDDSIVILEAKNVIHADFNIRQLYYPYRMMSNKVSKPIRLVFSVYSNKIFHLFEYRFKNMRDFSSIELVKSANYSLQDTKITTQELMEVRDNTKVTTDDNYRSGAKLPPFIQADSMDRVISLLENLYDNDMSKMEIASYMQFELRQSDYYFNAGKYLGLFEMVRSKEDDNSKVSLTQLGNKVYACQYKKRQLWIVSLILQHKIFSECFDFVIENGIFPSKLEIKRLMQKYNVCSESLIDRRSGSVSGWLRWIFNLTNI